MSLKVQALLVRFVIFGLAGLGMVVSGETCQAAARTRPNILLCISDDQSWPHVGILGTPELETPAFDRIAHSGVFFTRAFVDSPSCTPSRSAILTGQHIWRLKEAGNLHSTLRASFKVYPDLLEEAGYIVGYSGKGWAPGLDEPGGRTRNPAGPRFRSFPAFLEGIQEGDAFCYWLGSHYPHRPYPPGQGLRAGKDFRKVSVPSHLPDHPIVRGDLLDYFVAIEAFDETVMEAIQALEKKGLLDDTLIVVTSDNGMPFPRSKASLYDFGVRVPLAISWPHHFPAGRSRDNLVTLSDLAPTFLEACGLAPPPEMTGHSLLPLLVSDDDKPTADEEAVFFGMERHSGSRPGGKGYPCRAIRTADYLYIRNFEPDRWPAGDPDPRGSVRAIPYGEVDPSPSKTLLVELRNEKPFDYFFDLAFAKRPAQELYDLSADPDQLKNVATDAAYSEVLKTLDSRLMNYLAATGDARVGQGIPPWDYYPHNGNITNPAWSVDQPPPQ